MRHVQRIILSFLDPTRAVQVLDPLCHMKIHGVLMLYETAGRDGKDFHGLGNVRL